MAAEQISGIQELTLESLNLYTLRSFKVFTSYG